MTSKEDLFSISIFRILLKPRGTRKVLELSLYTLAGKQRIGKH